MLILQATTLVIHHQLQSTFQPDHITTNICLSSWRLNFNSFVDMRFGIHWCCFTSGNDVHQNLDCEAWCRSEDNDVWSRSRDGVGRCAGLTLGRCLHYNNLMRTWNVSSTQNWRDKKMKIEARRFNEGHPSIMIKTKLAWADVEKDEKQQAP